MLPRPVGHSCVAPIVLSSVSPMYIPARPRLVGEPSRSLLVATSPPDQSKAVNIIILFSFFDVPPTF